MLWLVLAIVVAIEMVKEVSEMETILVPTAKPVPCTCLPTIKPEVPAGTLMVVEPEAKVQDLETLASNTPFTSV